MNRRFDTTEVHQARSLGARWILGAEGVRWHLRLLAAAAVALVLVNIAADSGRLWSLPVIGVWALVVAVHAGLASPALRWLAVDEPVPAVVTASVAGLTSRRSPIAGPSPATTSGETPPRSATGDSSDHRADAPSPRPITVEKRTDDPGRPTHWLLVDAAPAPRANPRQLAPRQEPRTSVEQPAGTLPEEVVALWGAPVPAAATTIVEQYAGWRWNSPPDAPVVPATFAKAPPARTDDVSAGPDGSQADAGGPVPLHVFGKDTGTESSLAGD